MSNAYPDIDPDLVDVIQDLERGAPSQLFVLEPRKIFRAAGKGELPLRSSMTGLSKLDRHILDVHRHELAYLLRLNFLEKFVPLGHPHGISYRHEWPSDRERHDRRERLMQSDSNDGRVVQARQFLYAHEGGRRDDVADILAAAIVLEGDPTSRCYLAWLHTTRAELSSAQRIVSDLVHSPVSSAVRVSALECLGNAAAEKSAIGEAHDIYRESANHALEADLPWEVTSTPVFNVLMFAAFLGNDESAVRASGELEHVVPSSGEIPIERARHCNEHRQDWDYRLDRLMDNVKRIESRLSPPALEFLHALS